MIYSNSRLNTFENCPLQFRFRYLDKIESEFESVEAFLGTRFHEVMEHLYGELENGVESLDGLKFLFQERWDAELHENVVVVKKGKALEDYFNIGIRCIENYYRRNFPFDQSELLGIESRILIQLDETDRYQIQGFIDRLSRNENGTFEIHDYKTSNSLPSQQKLNNDRQLSFYQMGVQAEYPDAKDFKLIWHYVAHDKELVSVRDQQKLEAVKSEAIQLIDTIETTKEFTPKESMLCNWCAYQSECPMKKNAFMTTSFAAEPVVEKKKQDYSFQVNELVALLAEKEGLLKKIEITKQKINQRISAIVEILNHSDQGFLEGDQYSISLQKKEKYELPPKDSAEYLQMIQLLLNHPDLQELFDVKESELQNLLKKDQIEALEMLKSLLVLKELKTISFKKNNVSALS